MKEARNLNHDEKKPNGRRYAASERRSHQYTLDTYAVSESESEEESEETRSSETDSAIVADHTDEPISSELPKLPAKDSPDSRRRKALNVARELLATEENYVNILYLIDQVFHFEIDRENRAHPMFPPETVHHIFANIKSIYKFHKYMLSQLEDRMRNWDSNPRIGDIMKNFAPFFKMYTDYVKNFDYATSLIGTLQNKVPRFAALINEIQKRDECAKLSLAHHMLSPIQRLPRYELLLKDYLRNLNEDNQDYVDVQSKQICLVLAVAWHSH